MLHLPSAVNITFKDGRFFYSCLRCHLQFTSHRSLQKHSLLHSSGESVQVVIGKNVTTSTCASTSGDVENYGESGKNDPGKKRRETGGLNASTESLPQQIRATEKTAKKTTKKPSIVAAERTSGVLLKMKGCEQKTGSVEDKSGSTCDNCGRAFSDCRSLLSHLRHQTCFPPDSKDKEEIVACHSCRESFPKNQLQMHVIRDHKIKTEFICDRCETPRKFCNSSELKIHIRTSHDRTFSHVCDTCGLCFQNLASKKNHETLKEIAGCRKLLKSHLAIKTANTTQTYMNRLLPMLLQDKERYADVARAQLLV